MEQQAHIQFLLRQYISNAASPAQQAELMLLLQTSDYDEEQLLQLLDEIALATAPQENYDPAYWRPKLLRILQTAPVVQMQCRQFNWKKIAIAASIIIAIAAIGYFVIPNKPGHSGPDPESIAKDVPAPSTNRAQITLADGTIVYLDSADNGTLVQQGNIKLVKLDNGQIAYQTASGEIIKEVKYNTLSNPRGSKVIDMQLSDGSHVWLNAGSSVTYPVAFVGNERKISMTGEGYFEVAKDPRKKFIVEANGTTTEVLGTHFNVNAYDDESEIKVTLLEGSVQVSAKLPGLPFSAVKIKPNQQAVIAKNEEISVQTNVDIEQVMSWKNGLFNFNNANLQTVLRQLARWYDVTVVYEGEIPNRNFGGEMQRNLNLAEVLKLLEKNNIHFSIQGKTLKVKP